MTGRIFTALVMTLASLCAYPSSYTKDVWHALERGADVDVLFRVVDDEGVPVDGASCSGWLYQEGVKGQGSGYSGTTDTNGCFRVRGKCGEWFSLVVRKEGHYKSMIKTKYPADTAAPAVVDGKWQPYGETRNVVLKGIKHPHPMLGPDCTIQRKRTRYDEWLAFDLEKADFLPPIGEGSSKDMLVRYHLEGVMPHDWSLTMEVSFENNPYAGAYRLKKDSWSDMKSSYCVDTNATYQTNFMFRYSHRKGEYPSVDMLKEDEYMVFRTRTKVDRDGRLVSARYGKIYGPWLFADAGGFKISRVLMNVADNDLNLEDDRTADRVHVLEEPAAN